MDNTKESDSDYRIPPNYSIIEYSSDIAVATGHIVIQTTETVPDGYLLCDGSDVSRETQSILFNVIGTFYGKGDGSTTFCLPDLEDEENPTHHYIIKC
jgi:microcystin-dependent protein